jgi:hypothetical protein
MNSWSSTSQYAGYKSKKPILQLSGDDAWERTELSVA